MIPDSRISRIRFEAAAYTVRLPTSGGQFKPMVDIHSLSLRFTHSLANRRGLQVAADKAFGACSHQLAPRAQRSFAPEALPSFMATTTSCASPKASPQLRFYTRWSVFAAWTFRCWSSGPSRRYYCDSSLDAWTITPAASGVRLPVSSPRASAFPKTVAGRRSADTRATTSARTVISELQSFLYVQASRFASHPGRTHRCLFRHGSRDIYFRAPYALLPPHTSDMLAVRFRAIDGRGLAPHKIRSVVGRIHRF